MTDPQPRRIQRHLRRHGFTYAVAAFALSMSPVPSMAADLVNTGEIANGAVTTPKIDNRAVTTAKLAPSARGAKVIRYNIGPVDFFTNGSVTADLPGSWNHQKVMNSTWHVVLDYNSGLNYVVPGYGADGSSEYRMYIQDNGDVNIVRVTGSGEVYEGVSIYRTVSTSTNNSATTSANARTRG